MSHAVNPVTLGRCTSAVGEGRTGPGPFKRLQRRSRRLCGGLSGTLVQARFRGAGSARGRDWHLSEVARELAGLAGLFGWLGVLFYVTALVVAGPA